MDDIGNILYIVIAVIYFLYRIMAKSKRKAQKPIRKVPPAAPGGGPVDTNHPPKTKPLSFEDILRELSGEGKTQEPEVLPEPDPETEVIFDYDDKPEEEVIAKEVPSYKTMVKPVSKSHLSSTQGGRLSPFQIESKTSKFHQDIHRSFNSLNGAKKAFVFKEIFDRKY